MDLVGGGAFLHWLNKRSWIAWVVCQVGYRSIKQGCQKAREPCLQRRHHGCGFVYEVKQTMSQRSTLRITCRCVAMPFPFAVWLGEEMIWYMLLFGLCWPR